MYATVSVEALDVKEAAALLCDPPPAQLGGASIPAGLP